MHPSLAPELKSMEDHMDKAIEHLNHELLKIRAGKASPSMIDGITVDYYGTPTPINQVGTVSTADARTLTISPWEKKMIPVIERAIMEANLGFNPQSDGDMVRIPIPKLTEDRRKELVKQAKAEGENTKIALRKHRHDTLHTLKQLQKDGVSEDAVKTAEGKVDDITKDYNKMVDDTLKIKEEEIMTV